MSNTAKFEVPDAGDNGKSYVYNSGTDAHVLTDMATQAELDAHLNDVTAAHAASAISFTAVGTIAATDAQTAIAEVATDAASALSTHAGVTTSVHGIANTSALLTTSSGIDALSDVTITAAASGDILRHDGSAWVDAVGTTHFEAAGAVSTHAAVTTSVHGIADTSALLDTADIGVTVQEDIVASSNPGERSKILSALGQPSKLKKWRAAAAKVLSGTSSQRVLYIGDSTSTGYPTDDSANSGAALLVDALKAMHIPASYSGVFRPDTTGTVVTDSRLTYGSGWSTTVDETVGVAKTSAASTAGTFTFTPPDSFDTIVIWTVQATGYGTATVNVGGSTLATINASGTAALIKTTISCPSGSTVVNVVGSSGSTFSIKGIETSDSAVPRLLVHDISKSGARVSNFTTSTFAYSDMAMYTSLAASLAVVNLTINDVANGTLVATYQSGLESLTGQVTAAGGDVLMLIGATRVTPDPTTYYDVVYGLGFPVLSLYDRWGNYSDANPNGLMFDAYHPNLAGLTDTAVMVAEGLMTMGVRASQADLSGLSLTDVGTPASGDLVLLQDVSDASKLKVAQFSTFGGGASTLDGLTDVTITGASTGQVLKYNGSAWINDTDSTSGGTTALDDLSDVAITAAASGDILRHNGTAWVDTPGTTHFEAAGGIATHAALTATHGVSGALVGTTDSQTLTNKTVTQPVLTLEQGASVAPTAEGRIAWDTDDNQLKVGDGSGTKTFSDDSVNASTYLTTAGAPELIRDTIGTALVAGTNVTITVNDGSDTITIAASGGGGSFSFDDSQAWLAAQMWG